MLATICLSAVVAASGSALRAGPIEVVVLSPRPGAAVFGEVEFSAAVEARERIEKVELFVDGKIVASLNSPPYRIRLDVGDENRSRRFEAIAHGASGTTATAEVVTPKIEVDLEVDLWLQQLYVTVSRQGEAVPGLGREDFRVIDGGVEQQLVTFEYGDVPMTMALLVDVSESMKGEYLETARRALRGLLDRLGPLDEAMVLVFSDRLVRITEFFSGAGADLGGLGQPEAGGGTALNDYLYAALRLLDPRQGRPVVILLSDGADTLSLLGIEDVRWKLRRSNAVIYRIQMTGRSGRLAFATSWRDYAANRREVEGLRQAIEESGGRVLELLRIEDLEALLGTVLDELRSQYVLGYYPSGQRHDGSWRPVRIEVSAAGAEVRTRAGYVDQ